MGNTGKNGQGLQRGAQSSPELESARPNPPLQAARRTAGAPEGPGTGFRAGRTRVLERLGRPFLAYPFLHFVATNPVWAAAIGGLLLALLAGGAALPKVWRVTPKGFLPVVRISVVDRFQARGLATTALRLSSEGKPEAALSAWLNAAANDPGDLRWARGGLAEVLRIRQPTPLQVTRSLVQTQWLLRLGRTNQVDVELVAEVYARFGFWAEVYELLRPSAATRSATGQAAFAKALFHTGRVEQFARQWSELGDLGTSNPGLALYGAAYQAGWGLPERRADGWRRLEAGEADPALKLLVNRLLLVLHSKSADLAGYEVTLRRLEEAGADSLADHVGYWRLLVEQGRRRDAEIRAEEAALQLPPPWELLELVRFQLELGMREPASRLLKAATERYGGSPSRWSLRCWTLHGSLLVELRRWDELLWMATDLARVHYVGGELAGFAHFMEGRARHALSHFELGRHAFEQAARESFPFPDFGLQAAVTLNQLDYPDLAQRVLEPLETALAEDPRYWQCLFESVYRQRQDSRLLFKAARGGYRLRPTDVGFANNYAAALLLNRWQPSEACAVTQSVLAQAPDLVSARLNHAFALAMNNRLSEAEATLAGVHLSALTRIDQTAYHLAALEICLRQGHRARAREHAGAIDRRHLFPNQLEWLGQTQSGWDTDGLADAAPTGLTDPGPALDRPTPAP